MNERPKSLEWHRQLARLVRLSDTDKRLKEAIAALRAELSRRQLARSVERHHKRRDRPGLDG